jgi:hypothetical protein
MEFFRAGIDERNLGKLLPSHEDVMQKNATKKNCTMVNVAGLLNAFSIVLDEVLVRAEDMYHMIHRAYNTRDQPTEVVTGR